VIPAAPCDVLAVPGGGAGGWLVGFGEFLAGKPTPAGHVVVVTHQDAQARWIGIQGQPGGVGLVDCTPFLADSRTRSNHGQPKPDAWPRPAVYSSSQDAPAAPSRRLTFLAGTVKSLGIAYDWAGIDEDAADVIAPDLSADIDRLWRWPSDKNLLPGHVVCSSLAAMLYDLPGVGWAHPGLGKERTCIPSDWYEWNDGGQWGNVP
jgi:hypothetical protein